MLRHWWEVAVQETPRALQALEADLPFVRTEILRDALDPQIRPWRLGVAVFTAFGVLTREIGVRVGIGARRSDVVRLVVRDSLRVVLAGLTIGAVISLAAGPWIANLLFDVSPRDPVVFASVTGSLLATALLAAVLPSLRATQVEPAVALRAD